jgi:hypothetical protein
VIETYYAGVYWGARQEPVEVCARRAQACFQAMALCDPFLGRWFRPARSRKQRPVLFEPDLPTLQEMLAQRRVLNDDKRVIEDLGFRLSVNNGMQPGKPEESHLGLSVRCGVHAEEVGNACVLSLPSSGPMRERALSLPVLTGVMRAMVLAWEPGWGVATSSTHRMRATEQAMVGAFVGWVMYFGRALGTLPPLPAPVRVEPLEDKGTLVILTPERFTASNPEHVALAATVQELLGRAGLLKPLYG